MQDISICVANRSSGVGTSVTHLSRNVQVNPLAETRDGKLVAADAKLGFDDNAAFRQKELFAMRDYSQEDPRRGPRSRRPRS